MARTRVSISRSSLRATPAAAVWACFAIWSAAAFTLSMRSAIWPNSRRTLLRHAGLDGAFGALQAVGQFGDARFEAGQNRRRALHDPPRRAGSAACSASSLSRSCMDLSESRVRFSLTSMCSTTLRMADSRAE